MNNTPVMLISYTWCGLYNLGVFTNVENAFHGAKIHRGSGYMR